MNILPICFPPLPDEYIYSWARRLAKANGLSFKTFCSACLGTRNQASYDFKTEYGALRARVPALWGTGAVDGYASVSILSFCSLAMRPQSVARCVNNIVQPTGPLNTRQNTVSRSIRICPECMREDTEKYGEPYLHRLHQLQGVCTCHEHHVPLLEFRESGHVNAYRACRYSLDDYAELPVPDDAGLYTAYARELFENIPVTDAVRVAKVILGRLEELGHPGPEGRKWFTRSLMESPEGRRVNISDPDGFARIKLREGTGFDPEEITAMLMSVFPDAKEAVERIKAAGSSVRTYTCPVCGTEYQTATGNAWACPRCSVGLSDQELFERLVDSVGNGEYRALTPFSSVMKKADFLHEPCGRVLSVKTDSFLHSGSHCKCLDITARNAIPDAVNSTPGFSFVGFYDVDRPEAIIVRHEECGGEFKCKYGWFAENRKCRCCDPGHLTHEIFVRQVRELTGDEYAVTGRVTNASTRVMIRHNECGRETAIKPMSFLKGARCPYCNLPRTRFDFEEALDAYGNGRYSITDRSRRGYAVLDAVTGKETVLAPFLLLQETNRPTPSDILPLDPEHFTDDAWTGSWGYEFGHMRGYVAENGKPPSKRDYFEGIPVGEWLARQRDLRRKGCLPDAKAAQLMDAGVLSADMSGPDTSYHDARWMDWYGLYLRYTKENGSLYVPTCAVFEGRAVGTWVRAQRAHAKYGTLPSWRREMLLSADPLFFDEAELRARMRGA